MVDANLIIVSIYVDDILVTNTNEKVITEFKVEKPNEFEMTNLGLLSFFLGN